MIHAPRETRKDGYNLVMHVILFDIDGTLISTARAGADAFLDAMREDFGITQVRTDISMAGSDLVMKWSQQGPQGEIPIVMTLTLKDGALVVKQDMAGGQFTVGASAPICGLIGAILYYGHRSGSSMARSYASSYLLSLAVMGFLIPGIDNYAHAGGFGAGYLAAKVLDPLKPERGDHLAMALVCLLLSLTSIVVSVLHGLQFV